MSYRGMTVGNEVYFVLNDIEKALAEGFIRDINAGTIPDKGQASGINLNYECLSSKQEKIIRCYVMGCYCRLRYRDSNHIFFSAWDCRDVCGLFYDMVGIIYSLTTGHLPIGDVFNPFEVDLLTERYIFFATEVAASFVPFVDHIKKMPHKTLHNSQYIFTLFDESDDCRYTGLIERFKAEGYSKIQILHIWIRGDIVYYAIVDGAVLRPERQRVLSPKEEADFVRGIYKNLNDKFKSVKAKMHPLNSPPDAAML
jgi:hypothetical protein